LITKHLNPYCKFLEVAASIELAGSSVLFLREWVWELTTHNDLVGSRSIVIESNYSGILHCGEGRNVKQMARISLTILCICDWLIFDISNSYSFILSHKYTSCFILLARLLVWTLYTPRKQLHTSTLI